MPTLGRPKRLVNAYAEFWKIRELEELPEDMRGVYILFGKGYQPLYVGISGRGYATVKRRIRQHKSDFGARLRYFSAYDVDIGYMKQIETLILHALGELLPRNINWGLFPKGARCLN